MFLVLRDKEVKWYEAWVTFAFFWLLILTAWLADKIQSAKKREDEDIAKQLPVVNTAEFIAFLLEFEDKKEEEMEIPML